MKYLMIMIMIILLTILEVANGDAAFAHQGEERHYENKDFIVSYTITKTKENWKLTGRIVEASNHKSVQNINIWVDCKNPDGTTSGTVPNEKGEFKLVFPHSCEKVFFLKYGFNQFFISVE